MGCLRLIFMISGAAVPDASRRGVVAGIKTVELFQIR